jgi:hypothetical protein
MVAMFGGGLHLEFLPRWLQLLLATPVQFRRWRTQARGMRCEAEAPTWTC